VQHHFKELGQGSSGNQSGQAIQDDLRDSAEFIP
jgi:hypothetical protein